MNDLTPFVFGVKAEGDVFTAANCIELSDPILKLWLKRRVFKESR